MLEVKNLASGYARMPVLRDINLAVRKGEIVLVLGANGAGKTTLLKTIAGFLRPTAGQVTYEGTSIRGRAPEEIARGGLRLVLEGHRVFPELSVAQNMRLGRIACRKGQRDERRAEQALDLFPVLREKSSLPARDLSGGQQQMLALAQAFVARPKVLLCDELSLGLAQPLLPPILKFMREWANEGIGVLLVEQYADMALPMADRVIVMRGGEVMLSCAAYELRENSQLREAYLGVN